MFGAAASRGLSTGSIRTNTHPEWEGKTWKEVGVGNWVRETLKDIAVRSAENLVKQEVFGTIEGAGKVAIDHHHDKD